MDRIKLDKNLYFKGSDIQSEYDKIKAIYISYKEKMNNSDLSNSLTRNQVQLAMLEDLRKLLSKENNSKEQDFIQQEYNLLCKKLSEFGIKPKEL